MYIISRTAHSMWWAFLVLSPRVSTQKIPFEKTTLPLAIFSEQKSVISNFFFSQSLTTFIVQLILSTS
jgi:hypothetical protein